MLNNCVCFKTSNFVLSCLKMRKKFDNIGARFITKPDTGILLQSKEKGKDQESILSSTTPDPGHHMGK